MGTWGTGSFDDDDALDWLDEFGDADDTEPITEALLTVTTNDDYVEAPEAQQALAAAEVVAAMCGRPAADLPEEVTEWLEEHGRKPSKRQLDLARRAVERVRTDSELKELWEEQEPDEWYEKVDDLMGRLMPPGSV